MGKGEISVGNWYTRQEVADLLGVSKATVYHYAKQKKIIKIEDPHRLHREARYEKEAVDILAEERKRNTPTGMRPSVLAKELNIPVQRIYTLIHETDLPVEQLPSGDERMIYSIPEETANWIRETVQKQGVTRANRVEFYDLKHDIALYQLFKTANGQEMRVIRNEDDEWGFLLTSGTWIPYADGRDIFGYAPTYKIHQENEPVKGYTDFIIPITDENGLLFLDFIYTHWGIENIRVREQHQKLYVSIKSGTREVKDEPPFEEEQLASYLSGGDIIIEGTHFTLLSSTRRTTFDLPSEMLEELRNQASEEGITMSEFVEEALKEKLKLELE